MGEAELAKRFAARDPVTVIEMYRAYGRLVYTAAYGVLGDVSLAEEATQQTFVRAWLGAAGFDPGRALAPWLAVIAGRTATDIYDRTRRRRLPSLRGNTPVRSVPEAPASPAS